MWERGARGWGSLGAVFHLPCCLPLPILGAGSGIGGRMGWGGAFWGGGKLGLVRGLDLTVGVMKALRVCGFYSLEGRGVLLGMFGIHPWKGEHGV